jgi:hypothetical protein
MTDQPTNSLPTTAELSILKENPTCSITQDYCRRRKLRKVNAIEEFKYNQMAAFRKLQ